MGEIFVVIYLLVILSIGIAYYFDYKKNKKDFLKILIIIALISVMMYVLFFKNGLF